jgi:hypothetical protein
MAGTDTFKATIKAYLDERASTDTLFATSYAKQEKTVEECADYIISEVRKSGCSGFADNEIYSMAVHYYDEDGIKVEKGDNYSVVVNHHVELTAQEIAKAREEAKERAVREAYASMTKKKAIIKPVAPEAITTLF